MSQQINEVFSKFKKQFKTRSDEIKELLNKYYEKVFLMQKVINVDRIDATERIKKAGFVDNLSTWRNSYKNIIVSVCDVISGSEKRFDYKFIFTKEMLNEETVELIEEAIAESSRLKLNFKFDDAIEKIDEMLEIALKKKDEYFEKILRDTKAEIVAAKDKYEKTMEQIQKLEDRIKIDQKYDNLKGIINNCEKLIKLAQEIKREDLVKKYSKILEDTKKEIEERLAREKQLSQEEKKALEAQREQEKAKALEEKKAQEAKRAQEKAEAIEEKRIQEAQKVIKKHLSQQEKEALKEQKEQEKARALEEKEALKAKKAEEKAKAKEAKGAQKEELSQAKIDQILEQIAQLEESLKNNQDNDNLPGVISDCQNIIKLANSIGREDIAEKYAQILEDAQKELADRKALEKTRALEEKKALKAKKAEEKAKAKEAKGAQKEELSQAKIDQILEQIAQLEESLKNNQENDNLPGVISDCQNIIKLANSIGREDIAEKYAQILEDAQKELADRKALEKARALEEKEALKAKKAEEKAKAKEAKGAQKEELSQAKIDQILEQIAQLEESLKNNQENDNLPGVISDCQNIIKLANSIGREDIAEKYAQILEDAQKELADRKALEKARALEEKEALKAKKAEEKAKAKEAKGAQKEELSQAKIDQILEQIAQLEESLKNNQENDNLPGVISDCQNIIKLANSIGREDIAEKYAQILEDAQKELADRKALEKARALEEKKALKAKKAEEKAKAKETKGARKEELSQAKIDQILEQIAQLEESVKNNQENDNLPGVISDCRKIIKLANSIGRGDIALKYAEILEAAKKALKAKKGEKKTKAREAKGARKEELTQAKIDQILEQIAQLEESVKNNQENDNLPGVISDCRKIIKLANSIGRGDIALKYAEILEAAKKALKAKKGEKKTKAREAKGARKEELSQAKIDQILEQIAQLEESVKNNQENDNLPGVISDCRKIIKLANSIGRGDIALKYAEILEAAKKALKAKKGEKKTKAREAKGARKEELSQAKIDQILEQIAQLEESVKNNQENDNLPGVISDCRKIIKLANSIGRGDIAEKYAKILAVAETDLKDKKAREKIEARENKEPIKERALISSFILGGIMIILCSIANIFVLFTMIYSNVGASADEFYIFLFVNACFSIIGGFLVIIGATTDIYEIGARIIGFALFISLLGLIMFLSIGIWAGFLCGDYAGLIIISLCMIFGIAMVAVLIISISLKKLNEIKEIPTSSGDPHFKDKVLERIIED